MGKDIVPLSTPWRGVRGEAKTKGEHKIRPYEFTNRSFYRGEVSSPGG